LKTGFLISDLFFQNIMKNFITSVALLLMNKEALANDFG